jgi:cell division protein ZapA
MDSGTSDNKPVRVTIFNQNYTLVASGDRDSIEEIAASVDHLMHSISDRAGTVDSTRVAVLACLHLADQLRGVEKERNSIQERIDEKVRTFALLLDEALGKM